jgi:hypothetical protein
VLEEQLLGSHHERAAFVSGVPALDQFLLQYAAQQAKKGVTTVRVLVDSNASHEIIGYYTLSAAQVDAANLPPELQKKLPRYPVPCFRMGRLAVHIGARGKGYGAMLRLRSSDAKKRESMWLATRSSWMRRTIMRRPSTHITGSFHLLVNRYRCIYP